MNATGVCGADARQVTAVRAGTAELGSQIVPCWDAGDGLGGAVCVLAALKDGGAEGWCAVCWVGGEVGVDGEAACAFAEECDFVGIAAEGVDVASDPGEGEALVKEAEVVFGVWDLGRAWEAEDCSMCQPR